MTHTHSNRLGRLMPMALSLLLLAACCPTTPERFVRIDGADLITPSGEQLHIRGTNLGNWLNPEGYMFGFRQANSARFINEMFCQLVGPDCTAAFWRMETGKWVTAVDDKNKSTTKQINNHEVFSYRK